ncbi:hypothetical protein, partial [Corynebacterium casei]|uniref:hypothetical protein n=1 Tax=Corynebacterium casei TaxID=160386 RepID=UPI003FD323AC
SKFKARKRFERDVSSFTLNLAIRACRLERFFQLSRKTFSMLIRIYDWVPIVIISAATHDLKWFRPRIDRDDDMGKISFPHADF